MEVIVIGAVAAGMSAASKLKRNLLDKVNITVYEKDIDVSFGACGIPFYVSDRIKTKEELIARRAEDFASNGIDVKIRHKVLSVDIKNKTVKILDMTKEIEFEKKYDKLIISSGANVNRFKPFDVAYDNLYEIRNLEDGEKVKIALQNENNKNIAVIGAGFIGLEMIEACSVYGKNITLIELGDVILAPMDKEISSVLTQELIKNNINLKLSSKAQTIDSFDKKIKEITIETNGKIEKIQVDMVINCAGISPNSGFIDGLEKFKNGAIIVDENMMTSNKYIYAAGDCSIMKNAITGELMYAPLGTNANKQGRIIADVIAGKNPNKFKLIGSSAIKLFSIDAAKVGLSEKDAKMLNLDYKTNIITGNSYASYYSSEKLQIKIIYDAKTRKILGAQSVGQGIVVPRANYYAIAISAGMTVDEFGFLDLCYSPPFSGVWDASLIAANSSK